MPLHVAFSLTNDLDSQSFYNKGNLSVSVAKVGVFVLSFKTYQFTDSHLFNTVLSIINASDVPLDKIADKNYNYNDTTFHLVITFKNGMSIEKDMKLSQVNSSQPLDGLPTSDFSFTC